MNMRRTVYIIILMLCVCFYSSSASYAQAENETVTLTLTYGQEKYIYKDCYIVPDNFTTAQQIFERGINLPYEQKMRIVENRVRSGVDYKAALVYSFPLMSQFFDDVISKINLSPVDSRIIFSPDSRQMFSYTDEKSGVKVNEGILYRNVFISLRQTPTVTIEVPTMEIKPSTTAEDNKRNTVLRSRYSTDFSSSGENRRHNIITAMKRIDGKTLLSGETFSFNETVGRRTKNNGFREAKIIVNGKYVDGYGGGVCQASTTVYNAALLGGLTIEEVHRHTLKSSYELPSFDAMVNSATSDLKIRNDFPNALFFHTFTEGNNVVAEIYGQKPDYKIERESVVTFTGKTPPYEEIIDKDYTYFTKNDPPGSRKAVSYSHPEIHSEGYLNYLTFSGELIKRTRIRKDVYSKVSGVIAIAPDNPEYFAGWRVCIKFPDDEKVIFD